MNVMSRPAARAVVPALLLLLLAPSAGAPADRLDAFIAAEMKRQNIPGLSLAVVREGQVVRSGGYGLAHVSRRVPATATTVYKIASVSKQFIATGIMLLVQEGRLGLDDPIGRHLDDAPASWSGITIRHLLTHTAGLVREPPAYAWNRPQPDAVVVRSAYGQPLRFPPGEKWEYSNTGYFALAEVIRRVSGRPWTGFLADEVFTPSGMTTTLPTDTTAALPDRAQGYEDNDRLREAGEWLALRPSGAFLSTVLDLAKWDAMLDGDRILTAASRRQMWTPVALNGGGTYPYGFGWQLQPLNGRRAVHHGGGGPGARAKMARYLDDRLTVIVLINLDDVDVDAIVSGIARLSLPATGGIEDACAPASGRVC